MKASNTCLNYLKQHEGCKLQAYLCPAGVWTIGYGSTKGVVKGMTITQAQADERLKADLNEVEMRLNTLRLNLTQGQFDALCSFAFNVGWGNFAKSTLLKLVKVNPFNPAIDAEFRKWKYANGVVLPGLVKRREVEIKMYRS